MQELERLKVKWSQHLSVLRQTVDNTPKPREDTQAWANDVKELTAVLDGIVVEIQNVFDSDGRRGERAGDR